MNKAEQLDQLTRAISDAEVSLKSIQNNIEQLDKEINLLTPRKNELEQNISFHKKQGSIPIAHEYRKSRAELSKTTSRLILITQDRRKASLAHKDVETVLDRFKKDLASLQKDSENNVLTVLFGVQRGKK